MSSMDEVMKKETRRDKENKRGGQREIETETQECKRSEIEG